MVSVQQYVLGLQVHMNHLCASKENDKLWNRWHFFEHASTRHVHIGMHVCLTWLACKCTSPLAISRARREPFQDHLSRFLRSAAMASIRSPPCNVREDCCLSTYIHLQQQCPCSSKYYRWSMHCCTCIVVVLTAVMSDASRCRTALKLYGTTNQQKSKLASTTTRPHRTWQTATQWQQTSLYLHVLQHHHGVLLLQASSIELNNIAIKAELA